MDHHRIANLTYSLTHAPSRRDVLQGLVGTGLGLGSLRLTDTVEARKKRRKKRKKHKTKSPDTPCTPKCGRKECGNDGCGGSCGSCPIDQICASGTCCTPDPVEEICLVNCGFPNCPRRCDTVTHVIGTCGQPVACSCPSGQECLSNGTCGKVCEDNGDCPGQACQNCEASTEGAKHCSSGTHSCAEQLCTSTAECPVGTQCQLVLGCPGGDQNRCVGLEFCTG